MLNSVELTSIGTVVTITPLPQSPSLGDTSQSLYVISPRAVYKRVELWYTPGMKAYSQDLRLRVLRAIDAGASQNRVAEPFAISVATIKCYLKARREAGHVEPKPIGGRPAVKGAALQAGLREQLQAHPDATREQHCQMWEVTHEIPVSPASITRARQALGWTRKKSLS